MIGHHKVTGRWRKSVRSAANEACVEVAPVERGTAVRDAKNPGGAVLAFGGVNGHDLVAAGRWQGMEGFATAVKAGRLNLS